MFFGRLRILNPPAEKIFFPVSETQNIQKNKRLPNDSLFNLNQLNLINQKLTRTVSQMICLKYFCDKWRKTNLHFTVCFNESDAAKILFFNDHQQFYKKFSLIVNYICFIQNFLHRTMQQQ